MRSIVEEVLSKFGPADVTEPVRSESKDFTSDDAELEQLLSTLKTSIKVVGCGGGGCNTISRCVQGGIVGAEFYACNTDAQHLLMIHAPHKILLGKRLTRGLGAGALPQVGEDAAKEAEDNLRKALTGADLVFVTCGLGGGTGTGSAPIVARIAKELGAITVAVCTMPFTAEGRMRMENAMYGLEKLRKSADTVITVPNDKLIELVPRMSLNAAFRMADEVLMRGIKGITEIITKPGLVNLDFNDIRTVMTGGGISLIGMGESDAQNRAEDAVNDAINSPLIEVEISGATGALVNVTGGTDMTIEEAEKVAEVLQEKLNPSARLIWGAAIDPAMAGKMSVLLIVTGVKSKYMYGAQERHNLRRQTEDDEIELVE